jgi:hypothetical protein
MHGRSASQPVRFKPLAALAAALCVSAGCSVSARPPSDGDIIDPKARPASAPRERAGQVEPALDPRPSSGVASVEQSDLVSERMSFQAHVAERLQKLEQRVMAARHPRTSDPEAAAEVAKLIKAHDESRKACVEAQYRLVITTNDSWPSAREQLAAKLDALEGLIAKIEGSPGAEIDAP